MPTRALLPLPPTWLRRVDSPIGRLEITSEGDTLSGLAIERAGTLPHDGVEERGNAVLDVAAHQLDEYFTGTRRRFDVPVTVTGTAFQTAVWRELSSLNWGEVISYGELGLATGRPTAGRAVGGAVGANPVPIIIPCHRVLAAGGRITGYSAGNGVPTKVWLLDHENIGHRA